MSSTEVTVPGHGSVFDFKYCITRDGGVIINILCRNHVGGDREAQG